MRSEKHPQFFFQSYPIYMGMAPKNIFRTDYLSQRKTPNPYYRDPKREQDKNKRLNIFGRPTNP